MKKKIIICIFALVCLAIVVGPFVGCGEQESVEQGESLYEDISLTYEFEGEIIYFLDPATKATLPPGGEISAPVTMERTIVSMPEEYDSSRGALWEEVLFEVEGGLQPPSSTDFFYVLDRDTSENLQDERTYDFTSDNIVNREGTYCRLLPRNTSKDESYAIWDRFLNDSLPAEFLGEEEKGGISVYNFGINTTLGDKIETCPANIERMGSRAGFVVADWKDFFQAMGVDVDALAALAEQVLGVESPEDLQALDEALHKEIPYKHYWVMDVRFSVDPRTGIPVDVYKEHQAYYLSFDSESFIEAFSFLEKYADHPVLGQEVGKWLSMMDQIPYWPATEIYETTVEQTDASVEEIIEYAKSKW